jgi:predicted transcriptional regulator
MPEFTPEDVDIKVWEFVDACNEEEIEELLEYLKEEGYLDRSMNESISMNESMFMDALNKIKNNWLSLSREEEDVILNIAKRF